METEVKTEKHTKTKATLAIIFVAGITAMVACGSHATPTNAAKESGSETGGAALAGDSQTAKAGGAAATDFGRMRTVEIWDPLFNMVAYTMSVPKNWNFEGRHRAARTGLPEYAGRAGDARVQSGHAIRHANDSDAEFFLGG